jgi:small subunit ribosomal protein S8
MTDPISDFLSRIRNGSKALLPAVEAPHSRLKESIARILVREGYLAGCTVEGTTAKKLKLRLKYNGRKGVIAGLRRVSRPGLRQYARVATMPRVLGGLGVAIVSTPEGVMTSAEARRKNLGGEVLCYVW